jgi:hypothetical protein
MAQNAMNLDWAAARAAAKRVSELCDDAGFLAPEDSAGHRAKVVKICGHLGALVAALRIMKVES